MFHITVALTSTLAEAEVKFLHVFIFTQSHRLTIQHHTAVLQNIAEIGIFQSDANVLLSQ